jgi:transmembrane sensor
MKEKDILNLLDRYQSDKCSPQEKQLLDLWYEQESQQSGWQIDIDDSVGRQLQRNINNEIDLLEGRNVKSYKRHYEFLVAALLLMTIGLSYYFYQGLKKDHALSGRQHTADIAPGGNKAILTLADGSKISLKDVKNGEIAEQSGVHIIKKDGQLIYLNENQVQQAKVPHSNSLETPRGGEYQVQLPDGTKVWLNASSLLKFPSFFTGKNRMVELSGEAYFEVAKNKKMPFIVHAAKQDIEVLGTHFSVNNYVNEPFSTTTLLEGSVKIIAIDNAGEKKAGVKALLLKSGEQLRMNKNTDISTLSSVNTQDAIAWKDGYFVFNDESLESIMRKISRWYDVDVVYESKLENISFLGVVERSEKLSSLLRVLESTGNVHFKIEGRRVIVMP